MKRFFLYCLAMCCGTYAVLRFFIRQTFFRHRIPNFQEVDARVLMRGGKPSAKGLRELATKGIKTVIDLRKRRLLVRNKPKSMFAFHLPFSPYELNDQVVIDFLKILRNPLHHPAYVHCFHGADRTGALCAIYRIVCQNWEKEAAIAEMKLKGMHWWHANLIDYIRNLDVPNIRKQISLFY